ncbi:hypothetical protein BJX76DRAFT_360335 [Aspergillus varians]
MDSSLLSYARFHGIATDYTVVDPLTHIDDTFKASLGDDSLLQHIPSEYGNRLDIARVGLEEKLHSERLSVSKESARFLTSLIREVQANSIVINWDDILPDFHRVDNAKTDPPTFCLERESDVKLSKTPLRYLAPEIDLGVPDESRETADVPNPLASLRQSESPLMDQIKKDKVRCSKESFSLIQSVRVDAGPSVEELEGALGSILGVRCSSLIESESPVLLPLSTDYFPASPTSVPSEHMLPSPVSTASTEGNVYCHRTTPCEPSPDDIVSNTAKENPTSSSLIQQSLQERVDSTEGDTPSRYDTSIMDTSIMDTEPSVETSLLFTESFDNEKISITDATPEQPRLSVNNIPNPESGPCNSSHSNKAINEVHTKTARLPLSEDAVLGVEQSIVTRKYQQHHSSLSSRNEPSKEVSQAPSRHSGTSTVTKQPQKGRTGLWQEPPLDYSHGAHGTEREIGSNKKRPDQPPRVNLGSLSSFMETRGRGSKRQVTAKSPYIASKEAQGPSRQQSSATNPYTSEHQHIPDLSSPRSTRTPPIPAIQVPRLPTDHEGLVLFISTALLKTHLRVVQCLEGSEHPPKVIYHDYANGLSKCQSNPQSKSSTPHHQQTAEISLPEEADIILSPKTGIILTTSQATMQLYLPGHKSTSTNSDTSKPKAINSPLRESIFHLSPRYEQLYIFISHGTEQSNRSESRGSNPQLTADKRLLASLTSLTAFCTSMSQYGNITPLMVPSVPESMAAWTLALAHKHACQLPPPRSHSLSQYKIAFTPVNPKPQLGALLGSPVESIWEPFLRRLGLNPYAAQVVLAVLRRENGNVVNQGADCKTGVRGGPGYLSRFVEMPSEDKKGLFGGILGERILKRVDYLIERDWQCDWALKFDDGIE